MQGRPATIKPVWKKVIAGYSEKLLPPIAAS